MAVVENEISAEPVEPRKCSAVAPKKLAAALASAEPGKAWHAWQRHLARRKRPRPTDRLFRGRRAALAWCLPNGLAAETTSLVERLGRLRRVKPRAAEALAAEVQLWLQEAADAGLTDNPAAAQAHGYQCLAWCQALPVLAQVLPADLWWSLLCHLRTTANGAAGFYLETAPLENQLLAGELPLTLAYLFPELAACAALLPAARRALSEGPTVLLDGEGLPNAVNLALFRPLLACWTRSAAIGRQLEQSCWDRRAKKQFAWAVRQSWRLARRDGSQSLTSGSAAEWSPALFKTALGLLHSPKDRGWAGFGWPGSKIAARLPVRSKQATPADKPRGDEKPRTPRPGVHSEWAELGVLRGDWRPKSPRLTVAYGQQRIDAELSCGRDVLFSGEWTLDVRFDGQSLSPSSGWEEVCWVCDDDVDYLELQIALGESHRVQRQILLAKADQALFVADAVLGSREGKLECRSRLPLAAGVNFSTNDESRDGQLVCRSKPRATLLPVALPEWRVDPRRGSLALGEHGLELTHSAHGLNLFAPLWLDLDPARLKKPCTWRQLTVGQQRAIQLSDVAVGYRVQLGDEQWLIYRALAGRANRTLLGHNLSTEFLLGRFTKGGEVQSLLEIE